MSILILEDLAMAWDRCQSSIVKQGKPMRFAKISFAVAGCWGIAQITPLFFLMNVVGQRSPPLVTHPEFYFGFLVVTLAWQFAFLIISRDPVRYRPIMVAGVIEKFGFALACLALYLRRELSARDASWVTLDFLFGVAFVISYLKCESSGANDHILRAEDLR
jgi:hypothetical protein